MQKHTYSIFSLTFLLITEETIPGSRFYSNRTYRKSTQVKVSAVEIFIYNNKLITVLIFSSVTVRVAIATERIPETLLLS